MGVLAVSGTSYVPHILGPSFIVKRRKLRLGSQSGMCGLKISALVVIWEISYKNLHFLLPLESEAQTSQACDSLLTSQVVGVWS